MSVTKYLFQDVANFLREVESINMQQIFDDTPGSESIGDLDTFREMVLKHMIVRRFGRPTVRSPLFSWPRFQLS